MSKFIAKKSIVINASPEKVWQAIVDPELVKKYFFGTTVESSWRKGDPIRWTGEWEGTRYEDKGIILEVEQNKLLKYSYWSSFSGKPDAPENYKVIVYRLRDLGDKTEYIIEQEASTAEEAAHSEGNWGSVLEGMRQLVEKS